MRRKLGILFLAGITILAGTQEAERQFDGLRSSLNELTRASLWSGLIVYAQPVTDGQLPAPQIYYLMPPPQTTPAIVAPQQEPVLAENNFDGNAARPEAKSNHVAEEIAATSADALTPPLPLREIEDAAMSELVLDKVPVHIAAASHPARAPRLGRVRVYEEVARNEAGARKFRQAADMIARGFVKEFDEAKLEAELSRLAATHEQLETSKLKSFVDAEHAARPLEFKVVRRLPRPERFKVIVPLKKERAIALPEISSIGCEKTTDTAAPAKATVAAGATMSAIILSERMVDVETSLPVPAPLPSSTSWALGCDTEPEYK